MKRAKSAIKMVFSAQILFLLAATGLLFAAGLLPIPPTPKHPVTDVYHGVKVIDDYRWLEDRSNPEVQSWTAAQNQRTRAYLDAQPARTAIHQRLQESYQRRSPSYYDMQYRGGNLFAIKFDPNRQQPMLVRMQSPDNPASERVLVDPNKKNAKGSLAIDWFMPSLDGKLVGVAMSEGGSEDSSLYIFNTESGEQTGEVIPRVNFATAGGSMAWNANNSGFYYTRYPQGNERPKEDMDFYQQVYFHKLGTPASADTYVIGKDFPRIAEIALQTQGDGKYLIVSVANGDGGEFAHYVLSPDGKWNQITRFEDKIVSAALGSDAIYLLSRQDAPRGKVLRMPLRRLSLMDAETIIPQSGVSIEDPGQGNSSFTIVPTAHWLYVVGINGGPSEVHIYDHQGKARASLPLPSISSVGEMLPLEGDNVLFQSETFIAPSAWYRFDGSKLARTALATTAAESFDDAEVVREFAISKDGTKVPMNIIRRKGAKLDGAKPALLTAYGGYSISLKPHFVGVNGRLWLDQGGVYAIANLRGGGEYGEQWHQSGNLTHKQNVFDDFAACARHLIERKYTSPAKLAIEGGSNGGLLMGAALTQHPELYRAVVSHVGIYDMLRVELDPNGAFNVTEFGTVKDPAEFKALYAYSPYHHVQDGVPYPAVLFLTGDNDSRVNPAHSRKMTARLQAATSSKGPIFLRTSSSSGHGIGTALSERIDQQADVFAFLLDQLGINYSEGRHRGRM